MNSKETQNFYKYHKNYGHGINIDFIHDHLIKSKQKQPWKYVIIIPVCGERQDFLEQVFVNNKDIDVLVVLIINRPDGHPKTSQWASNNQSVIESINIKYTYSIVSPEGHLLLSGGANPDCLILDYNDQPLNPNKGVGLARKIAADTASKLIQDGLVSKPWIFSTDADVVLPYGYFDVVKNSEDSVSAISLQFEHVSDDVQLCQQQDKYDFKLRYYQQGLQFIGSKYHYIPLGSTLIIRAKSYVQVRGFPSKSGGEDFYILNKLAKVGDIHQPKLPVVAINIRYSDRVPFGTGPALQKMADDENEPRYYHPHIFHLLKLWRNQLFSYFDYQDLSTDKHGLNEFWQLKKVLQNGLKQHKNETQWHQFIDDWFDAFKILKSVHFLGEEFPAVERKTLESMKSYQQLFGKE